MQIFKEVNLNIDKVKQIIKDFFNEIKKQINDNDDNKLNEFDSIKMKIDEKNIDLLLQHGVELMKIIRKSA